MPTSVARFASGLAAIGLQLLAIDHSRCETAAKREYLTNFPNFEKLCTAFVAGYEPKQAGKLPRQPVLGRSAGDCATGSKTCSRIASTASQAAGRVALYPRRAIMAANEYHLRWARQ